MRHALALLLLALAPSCSVESPVASLKSATLIPGTSLGSVQLGRTSLREFVDTYGPGHVALLAGDDFCAVELNFEYQQLAFLFELDAPTAYAYENPPFLHAPRDLEKFIQAHPEVGEATVHSLSVNAKKTPEDTFFKGGIGPRAKLHATLDAFRGFAEDGLEPGAPSFIAGADERLPELRFTSPASGFSVYLVTPEGGGEPTVKRITLFPPGPRP